MVFNIYYGVEINEYFSLNFKFIRRENFIEFNVEVKIFVKLLRIYLVCYS